MTLLGRIISWPFLALAGIRCDRWAHLWIGTVLGLSSLWLGWLLAALPVIVYAVGKEAWDSLQPDNKADTWDCFATLVGGAVSIGTIQMYRIYA